MEDNRTRKRVCCRIWYFWKDYIFLQREWTYKTNTNWYITYIDIKIVGEIIVTSGISNPVVMEDVAIEKNQSVGSLKKIHN